MAALISFFLPWFQLSCGGQTVATLSGWQIASGIEVPGRLQGGHLYVFLILAALLAVLLLSSVPYLAGKLALLPSAVPQMLAGALCVLIPSTEYLRIRSQILNEANAGVVSLQTRFGFWGMLIAGLLLALLGFLELPRGEPVSRSADRSR